VNSNYYYSVGLVKYFRYMVSHNVEPESENGCSLSGELILRSFT